MDALPLSRRTAGWLLLAGGVLCNPWLVGLVATSDGRISEIDPFAIVLFACAFGVLAGAQLLWRWVEPLAWGDDVGLVKGSMFVALFAALIAGPYWGIATYNRGHSHTVIIPSELENLTGEQRQWAEDFYRQSLVAALKHGWFDFDTAMAQGFQTDRINRTHFPNLEYMFDDVLLDPERPEWLVYHDSPDGKVLMALMFFTRELEEVGPTPAGPLALWHYHPYQKVRCAVKGLWTVGDADAEGNCAEGIPVTKTPEMLHVWFIDHPLGRFTEMKIVDDYWQVPPGVRLWHPIAVHFVIALFIVSVLFDLVGAARRGKGGRWHAAGWFNLALAALSAIVAVGLGMTAEVLLRPTIEGHYVLDIHKALAYSTLAVVLVLFVWRYALRGRFPTRGAALYLLLAVTGVGLVSGAGYYGGQMVYEHGAGVNAIDRFLREQYWRQVAQIYRPPEDGLFEAQLPE